MRTREKRGEREQRERKFMRIYVRTAPFPAVARAEKGAATERKEGKIV